MSGKGYLLDTNIILGILKDHQPALECLEWADSLGIFAYSSITRMELLGFPGLSSNELETINEMLDNLEYLPLNLVIEDIAIQLRRHYRIKLPDAIIAATALYKNYDLLTLDTALSKVHAEQM